jgi:hypothetical protein
MTTTTTEAPNYQDLVTEAQQQALASLKQAQDFWLRATEISVGLIPAEPTFGVAAKLPTAKETVAASFGFAGKVLDANKAYAVRLAEILDAAGSKATPKA